MAVEQQGHKFLNNGLEEFVEYDKQCCLFLERMRHSSSFDTVQKIKNFVNRFVGTQFNSEKECSREIQNFIEDIFVCLRDHPLWRDADHVAWDWATEAAERYLMTKLFKVTYVLPCTTDINDDEDFFHRVRCLQFLKPAHFDIPERPLNQIAMNMAAQELHRADGASIKSPKEKLTCMLNSITILSNLLKYYGDDHGTGADDMLPYLIYTILIHSPRHMHSNIRYISRFRRESKMKSEAAYYFTQMESAVIFIMEADHRNLSINETDFKLGIYHCKENISSGLDINQFVSNSDPDLYGRRPSLATLPDKEATPSPILARKATVIEEWSNLQRTRALSHSKNTSDELCDISPLDPLPLSSATPTKPSPLLNRSSPRSANRNGQTSSSLLSQRSAPSGEEGNDGGMSKKLLTTRFEDLTISELKSLHSSYKSLVEVHHSQGFEKLV